MKSAIDAGEGRNQREGGEGEEEDGDAGGPVLVAEELEGGGKGPGIEGGLFEEEMAVEVGGGPVAALDHLAGNGGLPRLGGPPQVMVEQTKDAQRQSHQPTGQGGFPDTIHFTFLAHGDY